MDYPLVVRRWPGVKIPPCAYQAVVDWIVIAHPGSMAYVNLRTLRLNKRIYMATLMHYGIYGLVHFALKGRIILRGASFREIYYQLVTLATSGLLKDNPNYPAGK